MVCKKCGFEMQNGWKYCPNCSKKNYNKKKVIIIGLLVLIVVSFIVISIIKYNMPVDEKYVEKQLEKKYDEDFSNVSLIKSVENKDIELGCDSGTFGVIKRTGSTEYYKIYSKKNDIEFVATYNTSSKFKLINDQYEKILKRRDVLVSAYKVVYKYLSDKNYRFVLKGSDNEVEVSSENQLENILSKYEEKNESIYDFIIYINDDLYNFCKSNYDSIKKINEEILLLEKKYDYSLAPYIILDNNSIINLGGIDGDVYVNDKSSYIQVHETLDEFIKRENH